MRSFKTFLAEQRKYTDRPQAQLQAPGSGQMPKELGAGGTGGGSPAPRAVRRPFETIRKGAGRVFNFPYNLIPKGGGRRTAAKIVSLPVAPVGGVAAVRPILDKDVNEYLQSAGYDPEVRVTPAQSAAAYGELALKNPGAAFSLATSEPAMKKYVGPAIVGTAAGLATRNPLLPVVAGTPPGIATRRAIVDPIASAAGAEDIQTGKNPKAQDAARDYTDIIRRYADAEQKKVDMRRARKQGIQQAINPYYDPNRPKKTGSTNELEGIDLGF